MFRTKTITSVLGAAVLLAGLVPVAAGAAMFVPAKNAGGTVTYSTFTNGACNAPGTFVSIVTVVAGVIPNSRTVT